MDKYSGIASLIQQETSEIKDDHGKYKGLSKQAYESKIRGLDYYRQEEEHRVRTQLSRILCWVSVVWLGFTGITVVCVGLGWFELESGVLISFITSALAEVFGLWTISLKYFYKH